MNNNDDERGGKPSASSMSRCLACPGSVKLCAGLKPGAKSKQPVYTQEGEAIHATLAGESDVEELTPDLREKHERLDAKRQVVEARFGKALWINEKKRWWSPNRRYSGRFDRTGFNGHRAILIDYKTGRLEVTPAARNLQLRTGVVLLYRNMPHLSEIHAAIIQDHRPITTTTYDEEAIEASCLQIENIVKATEADDAPRIAGLDQCRFCPAAGTTCPEHKEWVTKGMDVPEGTAGEWGPEDWASFCESIPLLRKWIDSRVAQAKDMLAADPASIPGFFLKPGGRTEIDSRVVRHLVEQGYDFDELCTAFSVSKNKLRPVLGKLTNTKGRVLDAMLYKLCGKFMTTKRNAPTLEPKKEEPEETE
jgi:hypothetical protein